MSEKAEDPYDFSHGQLTYLQLPASDLEQSAGFYESVLGGASSAPTRASRLPASSASSSTTARLRPTPGHCSGSTSRTSMRRWSRRARRAARFSTNRRPTGRRGCSRRCSIPAATGSGSCSTGHPGSVALPFASIATSPSRASEASASASSGCAPAATARRGSPALAERALERGLLPRGSYRLPRDGHASARGQSRSGGSAPGRSSRRDRTAPGRTRRRSPRRFAPARDARSCRPEGRPL